MMFRKALKKAAAVLTAAAMAVSGTGSSVLIGAQSASLPAKFDLRDYGYVTSVKEQSPWNTCWGFAAIAAAETSILSKLKMTYSQYPIDLSEMQLAWFSQSPVKDSDYYGQKVIGVSCSINDSVGFIEFSKNIESISLLEKYLNR